MRRLFVFFGFVTCFAFAGLSQEVTEIDGICYSGGKPYTGKTVTHYDGGAMKMESSFKKGNFAKIALFPPFLKGGNVGLIFSVYIIID